MRWRFGAPRRAYRLPQEHHNTYEVRSGVDYGRDPQVLDAGFSPFAQNFVPEGAYITPRSGLSSLSTTFALGGVATGAFEVQDTSANVYAVIGTSGATVGWHDHAQDTWSTLSYVKPSSLSTDHTPVGGRTQPWVGVGIYELNANENIAVWTNGACFPKFASVASNTTTFSDFTWVLSTASFAKIVVNVDSRLVWFNVQEGTSKKPHTVVWSSRGRPLDYTLPPGGSAGAEDLMDMVGEGTAGVAFDGNLLLFSEKQVWLGTPRQDVYAFDFRKIADIGTSFTRTVVVTPLGVMFLGHDMELYLVRANGITAVGPSQPGQPSRVQQYLLDNIGNGQVVFGAYNEANRRYELYWPRRGSLTAKDAFFVYLDDMSVWPQRVESAEMTAATGIKLVSNKLTWSDMPEVWSIYLETWVGIQSYQRNTVGTLVFSSDGTPCTFDSVATTDVGAAFTAKWRSKSEQRRSGYFDDMTLDEVWLGIRSESASSVTIRVSGNGGESWLAGVQLALSASSFTKAFAPVYVSGPSPQFEIQIGDGGTPKIARMQARVRMAGRF